MIRVQVPDVMVPAAVRAAGLSEEIVPSEREWRRLPAAVPLPAARLLATRWRSAGDGRCEAEAVNPGERFLVAIALRPLEWRLSLDGRMVQDGLASAGTCHVTPPSVLAGAAFRGPYDMLHLHVPVEVIAEYGADGLWTGLPPARDPIVERLGRALLEAGTLGGDLGPAYAEHLGLAILARLAAGAGVPEREGPGLPKWRLKRVRDYVEAHLAEPLTLAEIASVCGLTRVHFATQFRVATGLPPHEFVLRRRIERAQELLGRAELSILEVALSVGFHTHSHFTSVFRRIVGWTPSEWRRAQAAL